MEKGQQGVVDNDTCQGRIKFDILEIGCTGSVEIVPKCGELSISHLPPLSTLPSGLPPLFPQAVNQLEQYLLHPEKLPIHDFGRTQQYFECKRNPESLYFANESTVQTSLEVDRNPLTGELRGYNEVALSNTGDTGRNSMSLLRQPGALTDSVKGQSTNYPFLPGGMESREKTKPDPINNIKVDLENDLFCKPPGFSKKIVFGNEPEIDDEGEVLNSENKESFGIEVINVADILANTSLEDLELSDEESEADDSAPKTTEEKSEEGITKESEAQESLDNILSKAQVSADKVSDGKPSAASPGKQPHEKEQWAEMVDVSKRVKDFHKKVPEMAYQWPFKLDNFQEHAVLRLEMHDSVFVAAHTSAGKTVVAEYAIALASKHMTRTIYTSPIKALSNQKFRDFKKTFEDVGLITGDVQINQEASCLIMTTEILRSMLYNGSDVIRDVEWVIFDEVHYVNDAERGVVWEEVLIMLPPHVNIILLSATVPNTLEFANWIGQTKRKKLYVISTPKRPVPLEHYLYTGNSNKTSNEQFLIVSNEGNFLTRGYQAAVDAKKERASKSKDSFGAKGARFSANPKQDRNVWLSLIEMLRKKDKLPVVAFTFSRKRCEENADQLQNLDLTTNKEKKDIQVFLHKCVSRLKGSDSHLPQVTRMQELLKRGLAVHHSGVLPIIKEMVEMLFQRGLVKLLFATETFAMGVNMPARTVVFDSIRKHDGTGFRDLLPSEYIQMAGRAGRRGLDTTGTVIILCKADVPEMADLHKMMLGKPTKLESRFRLTYSMILNLLRVEELRVEDMMKRSFAEFYTQCHTDERKKAVMELEDRLSNTNDVDCMVCQGDLKDYYSACSEMKVHSETLLAAVLASSHGQRSLAAGRVLVIDTVQEKNVLAVLLRNESSNKGYSSYSHPVTSGSRGGSFTVLHLCDADANTTERNATEISATPSNLSKLEPYNRKTLFRPKFRCSHKMAKITGQQIAAITVRQMKINADKILDGFKRAAIPRFRNEPLGPSVVSAEQELLRLTESNPSGLETMDFIKDFNLRDIDLVQAFKRKQSLEKTIWDFHCTNCPRFTEHFHQLDEQVMLQKRLSDLKFLLSDQSLQLLPEYHSRINVLNMLHYIKSDHTVELKGRVACEISNHELMITELVFESVFSDLHPAEIVALLSCFVFEQRRCSEPKLTRELEMGKQRILDTACRIAEIQIQNGMDTPAEDFKDQFHFGLVEVVFEWARGMPFAEITNLTDVQEGIIVRCIQRLNETCHDVRNAAKIIGDPMLHQKMEEASTLIKRDIVFAASLYTQ